MRVLLTVHQFFPDFSAGTEVLTRSTALELMRRGHEVCIFSGHPSPSNVTSYHHHGIRVERHSPAPRAQQHPSVMAWGSDNLLANAQFARLLRDFQPDVVHYFHLNRLGVGLIDQATQVGLLQTLTPTDFWNLCPTGQLMYPGGQTCTGPDSFGGNCIQHLASTQTRGMARQLVRALPIGFFNKTAKICLKYSGGSYIKDSNTLAVAQRLPRHIRALNQLHRILAPNTMMQRSLQQHGVHPHLLEKMAYGIDLPPQPSPPPFRSYDPQRPLVLGFIGTLAAHKGCHVLLQALQQLQDQSSLVAVQLRIYGASYEFPAYYQSLTATAGQLTEPIQVEFCGTFPNSHIHQTLCALDALVVPSVWVENNPLVIYSAQAAACPVIASDLPGMSDALQHNHNGLLFAAANARALAQQIKRLWDEPSLLQHLSRNAQPPKSIGTYTDDLLGIWAGEDAARPHGQAPTTAAAGAAVRPA